MQNILVPTDFSDCALNAAKAAISIAAKLKANIHFLHILPDPEGPIHPIHPDIAHLPSSGKGYAQNQLNQLVAKAIHEGLQAFPLLVLDKGNEKIEHYIQPLNIDLIVMGSHGATGIRELVIGSNTQRVVRHARVPVLVIKHAIASPISFKNIIFSSTFQEDVTAAFDVVIGFARLWKSTVHIFFLNFKDKMTDQKTIDKIVENLTKPYPEIQFTSNSAETNDEEFAIRQLAEQIDADMITLTTQDKTGFLLPHKVAEDLVNHEEIPVLAIGGV